jgi:hypothetical protein
VREVRSRQNKVSEDMSDSFIIYYVLTSLFAMLSPSFSAGGGTCTGGLLCARCAHAVRHFHPMQVLLWTDSLPVLVRLLVSSWKEKEGIEDD